MRAVVIGAKGELGAALVQALQQQGARIAALDLHTSARTTTEHVLCSHIDMRDESIVTAAIDDAVDWLDGVDLLINAAGMMHRGSIFDTSANRFAEIVDTNLVGCFRVTQCVAARMKAQGAGRILHVASVHALRGAPNRSAYAASKGGMAAFVRAAAVELGPFGVTINTLAPGPVGDGMGDSSSLSRRAIMQNSPVAHISPVSAIVDAALFLTSSKAGFITGQILPVDGGISSTMYTTEGAPSPYHSAQLHADFPPAGD